MTDHDETEASHTLQFRDGFGRPCSRATASRVRLSGTYFVPDVWLPWPESEKLISAVQQVARGAFQAGRLDAQEKMQRAMGVWRDGETGFFSD